MLEIWKMLYADSMEDQGIVVRAEDHGDGGEDEKYGIVPVLVITGSNDHDGMGSALFVYLTDGDSPEWVNNSGYPLAAADRPEWGPAAERLAAALALASAIVARPARTARRPFFAPGHRNHKG